MEGQPRLVIGVVIEVVVGGMEVVRGGWRIPGPESGSRSARATQAGASVTAVPRSDFISVLYRSVSLSAAATRAKPPRSSTACAPAAAAAMLMADRTTKSAQSAYLRRSGRRGGC